MCCWAAAGSEPERPLAWLPCGAASPASGSLWCHDCAQAAGHSTQQLRMAGGQHSLAQVSSFCAPTTARLHNSLLLLGRKALDQLSCSMTHNITLSKSCMGLGDSVGICRVRLGQASASVSPACCGWRLSAWGLGARAPYWAPWAAEQGKPLCRAKQGLVPLQLRRKTAWFAPHAQPACLALQGISGRAGG